MDNNPSPGQLIIPHGPDEPKPAGGGAPEPESRPGEQPQPAPAPAPTPEPSSQVASPEPLSPPPGADAAATIAAEPAHGGWFRQESAAETPDIVALPQENISWTASEFIAHDKSASWYALLGVSTLVIATLVFLVTKDKLSTGVIVFAAIAFGVFAGRKPQIQQYGLTGRGLQIGQKFYDFQDFKTFSIGEDGAIASIVLNPLKRFMPPLTIYMAPDIEEQIVNFLSAYLPVEQHKVDAVDSLLRRIRF